MNNKGSKHVPYRGSKLTLILKDCFTSEKAMTAMIATVSPGASAADHSLNTLRYADRIKEKRSSSQPLKKSPKRQITKARPSLAPHLEKRAPKKPADDLDDILESPVELAPSNTASSVLKTVEPDVLLTTRNNTGLLEEEEAALNMHMNFIAENAELLSQEGSMLQDVQQPDLTAEEISKYASALEKILDRKEDMIVALQEKLARFQASQ